MSIIQLEPEEQILYEVRKHPFAFYVQIMGMMIFALVPPLLYELANAFLVKPILYEVKPLFIFGYLIFLLFLWMSVFISWTDYFLDTWIVTNRRVIDFDLQGLFSRDIVSVRLENIQDVKIKISGIIATWLKIGKMEIQTAGEAREFSITNAYKPEEAKAIIMRAMESKRVSPTIPTTETIQ